MLIRGRIMWIWELADPVMCGPCAMTVTNKSRTDDGHVPSEQEELTATGVRSAALSLVGLWRKASWLVDSISAHFWQAVDIIMPGNTLSWAPSYNNCPSLTVNSQLLISIDFISPSGINSVSHDNEMRDVMYSCVSFYSFYWLFAVIWNWTKMMI